MGNVTSKPKKGLHTVIKNYVMASKNLLIHPPEKNDDISFDMGEGKDPQALSSINHPSLVPRV